MLGLEQVLLRLSFPTLHLDQRAVFERVEGRAEGQARAVCEARPTPRAPRQRAARPAADLDHLPKPRCAAAEAGPRQRAGLAHQEAALRPDRDGHPGDPAGRAADRGPGRGGAATPRSDDLATPRPVPRTPASAPPAPSGPERPPRSSPTPGDCCAAAAGRSSRSSAAPLRDSPLRIVGPRAPLDPIMGAAQLVGGSLRAPPGRLCPEKPRAGSGRGGRRWPVRSRGPQSPAPPSAPPSAARGLVRLRESRAEKGVPDCRLGRLRDCESCLEGSGVPWLSL